jgi:DNA-binding NtrC family response regulator
MERIVVLIDDDQDDIDVLQEFIRVIDPSASCISFSSSEKAIETLSRNSLLPDYIFIDYNMPQVNGEQCLAKLKGQEKLNRTTFVMNSTHMPSDMAERLLSKGANNIFQKPYHIDSYIDILTPILNSGVPG